MPYIHINIAKGRTTDQKKALAKSVTEAVSTSIGVDAAKIWVHIDEFEPENFATGGTLLSDKK